MSDATTLEKDIVSSVEDFEKETFDGIKNGLELAGKAVELIPTMLKDCSSIKNDLETLAKMALIFEHPLTLAYTVGKNLLVNGIDIYKKISDAVTSYKSGDYYNFGKDIGEALDEVFFKSSATKSTYDENAYDYLNGYFLGL
jgi:hypothetical protein